jgi:hypothetical protein
MVFMVIERYRAGALTAIYARLDDKGRMLPSGVSYQSSWIDHASERCWQIMEAPDEAALWAWARQWSDLVDFEIVPVRTSAETAALVGEPDAS